MMGRVLRWITAGESHGPDLVALVEGMVAGVEVTSSDIAAQLARRRLGYGRGARMKFEADAVRVLGGLAPRVALRLDQWLSGGPVATVYRLAHGAVHPLSCRCPPLISEERTHVASFLEKVLRTGDKRVLKRLRTYADAVNSLEDSFKELSDAELRAETIQMGYSLGHLIAELGVPGAAVPAGKVRMPALLSPMPSSLALAAMPQLSTPCMGRTP